MAKAAEYKLPECPHCGDSFRSLKDGNIPTHDFPKPCRTVCRGSGQQPRKKDSPLWKDKPEQEGIDMLAAARDELVVYGFAVVKHYAEITGQASGELTCPLCLGVVRFSVAKANGHCRAHCKTKGCINVIE